MAHAQLAASPLDTFTLVAVLHHVPNPVSQPHHKVQTGRTSIVGHHKSLTCTERLFMCSRWMGFPGVESPITHPSQTCIIPPAAMAPERRASTERDQKETEE
eukprot:13216387-Alexandrium_andersonii.AAC.1